MNKKKYDRYAELVDKFFRDNLSEQEEKELKELTATLDEVEEPYYREAKELL